MKKLIQLLFFWGMVSAVSAQPINPALADSLKFELKRASKDTSRVLILEKLARCYASIDIGSAERYGRQGYALAQKIGYMDGKLKCAVILGFILVRTSQHAEALRLLFEAKTYAELHHKFEEEATAYSIISNIYSINKEYEKAFEYALKAQAIYQKRHIPEVTRLISLNLGAVYRDVGQLDTALMYFRRAYKVGLSHNVPSFVTSSVYYLADTYVKDNQIDTAFFYYRKCIEYSFRLKTDYTISRAYLGLARLYAKSNQVDSTVYYGNKALQSNKSNPYHNVVVAEAASILAKIYDAKNNPVAALNYYKLATQVKDSIFSLEKTRQIEKIGFEEKVREIQVQKRMEARQKQFESQIKVYTLLGVLVIVLVVVFFLTQNIRQKKKANSVLEQTLNTLRSTQAQLIQSEKLASLGELTAGIAHEIQNPLNFVNNFAEVSAEMIDDLKIELEKGDITEVKAIAEDLQTNLGKINHHGQRASSIVRAMLEHSRQGRDLACKVSTNLNALADEYLRLAYHGWRAKNSSFNCQIETHFDPDLPMVEVIPQDIGRVLLNLINNAFYAVHQRTTVRASLADAPLAHTQPTGTHEGRPYEPTVTVSTQKTGDQLIIMIKDNGPGIPESIREKIFQPFFTTKPTGQGTGLGLSLAYDIVVKGHGGALEIPNTSDTGTTFMIRLPVL